VAPNVIKALLYTSHLFSFSFCCCGANFGEKKNITPNIGENKNPLYISNFLFFLLFFVVLVVQKLAKTKTLCPILARIEKHIGPQIITNP
jgi:hypothetical protein